MTTDDLTDADIAHLRRALELADRAGELGNRPFGAVLIGASGDLLAEGLNRVASDASIIAHAEIDAVMQVASPEEVVGSTVYASGEPCPMCSAALVWAGVRRIVFAAADPDFSPLLAGGPRFNLRCREVVASSDQDIEIVGPALGEDALAPFRAHG